MASDSHIMNSIEHFWFYLENNVRAATLLPLNVRESQDQLESEVSLYKKQLDNSIQRRCWSFVA